MSLTSFIDGGKVDQLYLPNQRCTLQDLYQSADSERNFGLQSNYSLNLPTISMKHRRSIRESLLKNRIAFHNRSNSRLIGTRLTKKPSCKNLLNLNLKNGIDQLSYQKKFIVLQATSGSYISSRKTTPVNFQPVIISLSDQEVFINNVYSPLSRTCNPKVQGGCDSSSSEGENEDCVEITDFNEIDGIFLKSTNFQQE